MLTLPVKRFADNLTPPGAAGGGTRSGSSGEARAASPPQHLEERLGIARPAGPPLVHFAAGVDVEVFALT